MSNFRSMKSRKLSLETLEGREMLSVNPLPQSLAAESITEPPAFIASPPNADTSEAAPPLTADSLEAPEFIEPSLGAEASEQFSALTLQEQSDYEHNLVTSQGLDGYATWTEIDGVERLTAINANNVNLTGALDLSNCTKLQILRCEANQLTSLNISGCKALQTLQCGANQLTSLNVAGLTQLQMLHCYNNQLTSLNVSGLTNLTELKCHNNQLTTLNITGLTQLHRLHCDNNQLTSLNVAGLPLETLNCSNNQLTSLNVAGSTMLNILNCSGNQLTSLNVAGLSPSLQLNCSNNQLTSLITGTSLSSLDCRFNKLTFTTLPVFSGERQCAFQADIPITSFKQSNFDELQSQILPNGGPATIFAWRYANGTLVEPSLVIRNNAGVFTFDDSLVGKSIYCVISNQGFPDLTLTTTVAKVEKAPDSSYTNAPAGYNAYEWNLVASLGLSNSDVTWQSFDGQQRLTAINAANKNLTGTLNLSSCTRLQTVNCSNNQLTSLNVAGLTMLNILDCSNNQLTSLNVSGLTNLAQLICQNNQLTSLNVAGLYLGMLNCSNNQLTSLSVAGMTGLSNLNCSGNQLTSLNVAGLSSSLQLNCSNNQLTSLVTGSTYLSSLDCRFNKLTFTTLPLSSSGQYAFQADIPITSFKQSNFDELQALLNFNIDGTTTTFEWRYANGTLVEPALVTNNQGVFTFATSLAGKSIFCAMTNSRFPELNLKTTVAEVEKAAYNSYEWNLVASQGLTPYAQWTGIGGELRLTGINITPSGGQWPVPTGSLDLSGCTALRTLQGNLTQLTSLDVSGCTALQILNLPSGGQLTSLDVSGCTALQTLNLPSGGQLTSLDASGCTALRTLSCYNNQLTSLDVSGCAALQTLDCGSNKLTFATLPQPLGPPYPSYTYGTQAMIPIATSFAQSNFDGLQSQYLGGTTTFTWFLEGGTDVSNSVANNKGVFTFDASLSGKRLYCEMTNSKFSGLMLRTATAEVEGTSYNAYERNLIDSQGLTAYAQWSFFDGQQRLVGLVIPQDIRANLPDSIDLSGCTKLVTLDCANANITSLNVAGCTALRVLRCQNNQLTSLNVSNNTMLQTLICFGNQLTSLNVAGLTQLQNLHCQNNRLTSLNVAGLTQLQSLNCSINQLTTLNVAGTSLTTLDCSNNQLNSLNVAGLAGLTNLHCGNNKFTFATLPQSSVPGTYSFQAEVPIAASLNSRYFTDLQSQYLGGTTTFTWRYANGAVVDPSLVTNTTGIFTFDVSLGGQSIYCEMTNSTFPNLVLTTALTEVERIPHNIDEWNAVVSQGLASYAVWTVIGGEQRLTAINADNQGLTGSLDLSGFTALQTVNCADNQLTSLDITGLTKLQTLNCTGSQLATLDIIGLATEPLLGVPQVTASQANGLVTLNWTAIPSATLYSVYRLVNGKWVSQGNVTGTTFTETVPLSGDQRYAVRVLQDTKQSGCNEVSINVTTIGIPQVTPTQSNGNVTLTWTAIPDAERYCVYRLVNGKWASLGYVTGTTFVDNTVPEGLQTYAVRAFKGTAMSDYQQGVTINV